MIASPSDEISGLPPSWFNCASNCALSRARFLPCFSGLRNTWRKVNLLFHPKRIGVRLQIGTQLVVGRLGLGGNIIGDEFHLLLQAAADDGVVLVQAQRQRLAVIDFLAAPGRGSSPPTPRGWAVVAGCG